MKTLIIYQNLQSDYCRRRYLTVIARRADCDEVMEADSLMTWERDVPVKLRMEETGPLSEKPICVMTALRITAEKHPYHPALGLYSVISLSSLSSTNTPCHPCSELLSSPLLTIEEVNYRLVFYLTV